MKNTTKHAVFLCLMMIIGLLAGCTQKDRTPPENNTPETIPLELVNDEPQAENQPVGFTTENENPLDGDWSAAAEFGKFDFTVKTSYSSQVEINSIQFVFSDWTCSDGSTGYADTRIGNVNWEIKDDQFDFSTIMTDHSQTMQVSGRYDPDTQLMSGAWTFVDGAAACSGSWVGEKVY